MKRTTNTAAFTATASESAPSESTPSESTPSESAPSETATLDEAEFVPTAQEQALMQAVADTMTERFIAESLESVARAEELCLALEQEPRNEELAHAMFGVIHTIKGNAGFMGFAEIERLAADVENILEAVRAHILSISPELVSAMLTNVDNIKGAVLSLGGVQADPAALEVRTTPASSELSESSTLSELSELPELPVQESQVQTQEPSRTRQPAAASSSSSSSVLVRKKDIRVDTEKLDVLFDLIGELITVEAMVSNHPDLEHIELPNFHKATRMLNKITRELQEVSTALRMMPMDGLFKKMQRLVRDLSVKFSKEVRLEIYGAETEMDKNVIEDIADPLMHILRNAMDHGIESHPTERRARGKSEHGTIRLGAQYDHNSILITIEDDGQGLQREKILQKAIAKRLVRDASTQAIERLTDAEVWAFIFEPGFSTAEKITDTSGRGVGMDVVKKNIERLQGSISVDSKAGAGTTIHLRIPLTLAIMDAMLVRVGAIIYALPILAIRHSFRPTKEQMTTTMDGLELVRVRQDVFPVIRLHEVFHSRHAHEEHRPLDTGILVTVESHERRVCLFVDEILGQQQIVVKGLSEYIGNVSGVMGCMILANGEIGLIIDMDCVVAMFEGVA
jgi:two-component system chemotaxis sensor kinase CheA